MANEIQTVWIVIKECGEHADYLMSICSVWNTKETANECVDKLREDEKASRLSWATQAVEFSIIEVPMNRPGNYWLGG